MMMAPDTDLEVQHQLPRESCQPFIAVATFHTLLHTEAPVSIAAINHVFGNSGKRCHGNYGHGNFMEEGRVENIKSNVSAMSVSWGTRSDSHSDYREYIDLLTEAGEHIVSVTVIETASILSLMNHPH
jgi:hypothetical protein